MLLERVVDPADQRIVGPLGRRRLRWFEDHPRFTVVDGSRRSLRGRRSTRPPGRPPCRPARCVRHLPPEPAVRPRRLRAGRRRAVRRVRRQPAADRRRRPRRHADRCSRTRRPTTTASPSRAACSTTGSARSTSDDRRAGHRTPPRRPLADRRRRGDRGVRLAGAPHATSCCGHDPATPTRSRRSIRAVGDHLLAVARKILRDPDAAEDALQQAVIRRGAASPAPRPGPLRRLALPILVMACYAEANHGAPFAAQVRSLDRGRVEGDVAGRPRRPRRAGAGFPVADAGPSGGRRAPPLRRPAARPRSRRSSASATGRLARASTTPCGRCGRRSRRSIATTGGAAMTAGDGRGDAGDRRAGARLADRARGSERPPGPRCHVRRPARHPAGPLAAMDAASRRAVAARFGGAAALGVDRPDAAPAARAVDRDAHRRRPHPAVPRPADGAAGASPPCSPTLACPASFAAAGEVRCRMASVPERHEQPADAPSSVLVAEFPADARRRGVRRAAAPRADDVRPERRADGSSTSP